MKARERWYSERPSHEITLVRWGELGMPVLVFPTAGGDAQGIERNWLVPGLRAAARGRPGQALRAGEPIRSTITWPARAVHRRSASTS